MKIERIKQAVLVWKDKGNEIIDAVNRPITAIIVDDTNGEQDNNLGTVEIEADKDTIVFTFYFATSDLIACDAEGDQHTFRVIGYQLPDA